MNKKMLLFAFVILNATGASAADDILSSQEFKLKNLNATAQVTIRKTAVVVGMPYSLELRVNCDSSHAAQFKSLPVLDSKNICDVKPKSLRILADGESIGITVREVDSDSYNEQTRNLPPDKVGEIVPACKKQASEFVFHLKNICHKN